MQMRSKKRREVKERNDLTPSRQSNCILVEKVALAQKNATLQKKNNDSVAASTVTTRNIQSTRRKKVTSGKRSGEEEQVLGDQTSSPAPATTTARKLPVKRKKRFGLPDKKKQCTIGGFRSPIHNKELNKGVHVL
ncbi:hypothetical protein MHU86_25182 [Fragilaria crotonensis]|nr:hypothetical protein MHU86_25182 [Fragilaria crotonensis]